PLTRRADLPRLFLGRHQRQWSSDGAPAAEAASRRRARLEAAGEAQRWGVDYDRGSGDDPSAATECERNRLPADGRRARLHDRDHPADRITTVSCLNKDRRLDVADLLRKNELHFDLSGGTSRY